jgi:hypothetical protein
VGESGSRWWLGIDRKWRQGDPPPRWVQARDGRWHPPHYSVADTNELPVTQAVNQGDVASAQHLAPAETRSRWDGVVHFLRTSPPWMRLAAPLVAVVVVLGGVGLAALSLSSEPTELRAGPERPRQPSSGENQEQNQDRPRSITPGGESPDGTASSDSDDGSSESTSTSSGQDSSTSEPDSDEPTTAATSIRGVGGGNPSRPTTTTTVGSQGEEEDEDPFANCSPGQRAVIDRDNHNWSWYEERFDPDGNGVFCD